MHPADPAVLRALHLEDSPEDGELVAALLQGEWPACHVTRVDTRKDFEDALSSSAFDFILSDNSLPGFDGLSALERARGLSPQTPFIFLSGTIGEERAIEALQRGAADYVLKDRPARLVPAVRQALHRSRVEAELRLQQARIQEQAALLDQADDAIVVRDFQDRATYWNHGAERLFGWTSAEMTEPGSYLRLFRMPSAYRAANEEVLSHGEWTGELRLRNKAGRDLRVHSRWTLLRQPDGRPSAVLSLSRDITEQKELETRLLRTQRLESIGMLAGGIAHDLNNVLAPILMGVSLLQQKHTADAETTRLLGLLETSAKRGSDLVRQVLAFARGGDGERADVDPSAVITEVVRLMRETLPPAIAIQTAFDPDLWPIRSNSTELGQVVMNLCVNSRDAMTNGGVLTVAARNHQVDAALARANPGAVAGPHVLVSVADTGSGIPPELIDRIFDPFFTTKAAGKGTGLGLSTVLGIVRSHGGFLQVESRPGRGTDFRLYFPAAVHGRTEEAEARPAELPRGQGETVLVIEDEESVRQVIEALLASRGFKVIGASGGAEGMEVYRRQRGQIQAVLTDMMMPGMQGPEVVAALRAINPDVRIVVMSGVLAEAGGVGEEPGRLAFMQKPMTAEQLLQTLRRVLPARPRP